MLSKHHSKCVRREYYSKELLVTPARCALTYNLTRVLNIVGVEPLVRYLRNDLKAARTSSENSFGSSQAAKCPPRSTSLK
jgi:hypothetical protein